MADYKERTFIPETVSPDWQAYFQTVPDPEQIPMRPAPGDAPAWAAIHAEYEQQRLDGCLAIAEKLGVATILEGSVRRAGQRIRVTAQLVEAEHGSHLWSSRYDREMSDVFAVQDEIAAARNRLLVRRSHGAIAQGAGKVRSLFRPLQRKRR